MTQLDQARGPSAPIAISITWAMLFLLGAWPAVATVFLFDSGADLRLWGWLIFWGMWGFEALALLLVPGIWVAWALTRHKSWGGELLFVLAFVPVLALVPIVVAFFVDSY